MQKDVYFVLILIYAMCNTDFWRFCYNFAPMIAIKEIARVHFCHNLDFTIYKSS